MDRLDHEAPDMEFDEDVSAEDRQETIDFLNDSQELIDDMKGTYRDMTEYD